MDVDVDVNVDVDVVLYPHLVSLMLLLLDHHERHKKRVLTPDLLDLAPNASPTCSGPSAALFGLRMHDFPDVVACLALGLRDDGKRLGAKDECILRRMNIEPRAVLSVPLLLASSAQLNNQRV